MYPSLFEGFGLEIIESAIMETPALFSNIKPMNLILKGLPMIDNPENPKEIYEKINTFLLKNEQISVKPEMKKKLINTYCHDRYVNEMELALSNMIPSCTNLS